MGCFPKVRRSSSRLSSAFRTKTKTRVLMIDENYHLNEEEMLTPLSTVQTASDHANDLVQDTRMAMELKLNSFCVTKELVATEMMTRQVVGSINHSVHASDAGTTSSGTMYYLSKSILPILNGRGVLWSCINPRKWMTTTIILCFVVSVKCIPNTPYSFFKSGGCDTYIPCHTTPIRTQVEHVPNTPYSFFKSGGCDTYIPCHTTPTWTHVEHDEQPWRARETWWAKWRGRR